MAKVIVVNHVTLDGLMQAPARPDEDTREGFAHGGWAIARSDGEVAAKIGERMAGENAFLFGRRTYEDFFAVWPARTDSPFGAALTNTTKYVASRTLSEPLPWANSVLLAGDAPAAVADLRRDLEGTITIFGSGELIASLAAAAQIDEYLLMIHPLVLGAGRRLFAPGVRAELQLLDSGATGAGVVVSAYAPTGPHL
jgi:dihydrofolate reductase